MRLGPGLSFSWRRTLGVSAFKGRTRIVAAACVLGSVFLGIVGGLTLGVIHP